MKRLFKRKGMANLDVPERLRVIYAILQRCKSVTLGQGPGSASRDTHNNIFKLLYRIKIPNKLKMLAFFIPEKVTV